MKQEAQGILGEGERLLDEANQLSDNMNKEIEVLKSHKVKPFGTCVLSLLPSGEWKSVFRFCPFHLSSHHPVDANDEIIITAITINRTTKSDQRGSVLSFYQSFFMLLLPVGPGGDAERAGSSS